MTTAMVLCAGFGTRLRPLTDELPKPLMPVGDRPVLAHIYESLVRRGVREVVVNTHHRASDFENPIKAYAPDLQVLHESEILGTAGGVSNAASTLGAADVVTERTGAMVVDKSVQDVREQVEREVRARLGPDRWATVHLAGRKASIDSLMKDIELDGA